MPHEVAFAMNNSAFSCDVFHSHSAKDKTGVRPLAERLRVTVREHRTSYDCGLNGSAFMASVLHPPGAHA